MNNKKNAGTKRRTRRKIIIAIEVLVMIVAVFAGYMISKINKLNRVDLNTDEIVINEEVSNSEVLSGFTNIALFGMDSRDGLKQSGSNTDTMIVASINNESGEINMVSLYRDTYMDLGNGSFSKANAAYAGGGAERALSMLNKSMDLNLTDFIATDFKALTVCIDCMGGLDVNMTAEEVVWMNGYVAETTRESGIWSATLDDEIWDGVHHLNGTQATAFCRIRYTVGDDYKRTERQRYILSLIFEKAKTLDTATLNSIADEVFPLIYTNVSLTDIVKVGSRILKFKMGETFGVPEHRITGNVGKCGDCVVPTNWANDVIKIHEVLFKDHNYTPSSTVYSISNYVAGVEVTHGKILGEDDEKGILIDVDGDGVPDGYDIDGDGVIDAPYTGEDDEKGTLIDVDGDGVPDGYDTDGDGVVDVPYTGEGDKKDPGGGTEGGGTEGGGTGGTETGGGTEGTETGGGTGGTETGGGTE